ncbi:MAG TPA: pyruvate ferredoxin oxidoreductase [Candidatus Korarchaeota archaeon]|nr:pyruvate ferredoxin oxidoreductase [Candidatus Korarchaeota archaeon]HDI73895.1 pyruvate ferredoxin oxidoreductase [Candidatus Korarchaeota archaeon]
MALNGDEAVAWAVKQSNVDVVAAYPITPQTIIVERISEFVHNGEVDMEFIKVESEHSALSASWGAALAGARAFTATAANGLALMWEILYITASTRTPVVMAVVNRALSAPINIHNDHSDTMGARDSGWIQMYSEDAQEAYDNTIMAFRIAEEALLPVMITLDGFTISHTLQNVSVLPDEVVSEFVGVRKIPKIKLPRIHGEKEIPLMLNPKYPISFGPLDLYDYYFEHKVQQNEAMLASVPIIEKVHKEYGELSGRSYEPVHMIPYRTDDADVVILGLSSTMSVVRKVVDQLREEGKKVGAIRLRVFRPFPAEMLRKELSKFTAVGVLDRCLSFGAEGGPVFAEVRSALYSSPSKPAVYNYVYGLGGRDLPPRLIAKAFNELLEVKTEPERPVVKYLGVRE